MGDSPGLPPWASPHVGRYSQEPSINAVKNLEPPDTHHLKAAVGWLELGNHAEAGEEIARVSAANLNHPDVLEVRWAICAEGKSWAAAAEVAQALVTVAPERASGWVHRAYAVRRAVHGRDRKSTRLNSSHLGISYAVFCLKKKKTKKTDSSFT